MGKRLDQHLQETAAYTAAPESVQVANAKRAARIAQEKRYAPPPSQPQTEQDDAAHARARVKLRAMGFLSDAL